MTLSHGTGARNDRWVFIDGRWGFIEAHQTVARSRWQVRPWCFWTPWFGITIHLEKEA